MKRLLFAVLLASPSAGALAQTIEAGGCPTIFDPVKRLECFDKAVREATSSASPTAPTANTSQVVAATASEPAQLVDPEDMYIAPRKFIGKQVELRRMMCLHADKDEFRCLAPGSMALMIVAPSITPTAARSQIESECGQIKKINSPACRKTLRFMPLKADEDTISAFQKRQVVLAINLEIVEAAPELRRRRR